MIVTIAAVWTTLAVATVAAFNAAKAAVRRLA